MSVQQQLLALVERNLSLHLLEDAKFYAERLYYEAGGSQESLNILAQCYFRQGKTKQVCLILQNSAASLANRYLLATCCYALNKLEEAEAALAPHGVERALQLVQSVPGGAAGLYLLGCVCRRSHRKEISVKLLTASLQVRKKIM